MAGVSKRVTGVCKRATRWRLRGGLALAIIAPVIAVTGATVPAASALAAPRPPRHRRRRRGPWSASGLVHRLQR